MFGFLFVIYFIITPFNIAYFTLLAEDTYTKLSTVIFKTIVKFYHLSKNIGGYIISTLIVVLWSPVLIICELLFLLTEMACKIVYVIKEKCFDEE